MALVEWAEALGESGSRNKTRVVLLVVNPYLVHAYWEIQTDKSKGVESGSAAPGQAVLRFHEAGESFDVEVDLGLRNCYVPLWSADKSYYAELGLRGEGESFTLLARSNVVHTPRALPVAEVEESFIRVAGPEKPATEMPVPLEPAPPLPPDKPQLPPTASDSRPPQAEAPVPRPTDSTEVLRRKLAEYYALRVPQQVPLKPADAPVRELRESLPEEAHSDLTELAEKRQTTGCSSDSLPSGRPES